MHIAVNNLVTYELQLDIFYATGVTELSELLVTCIEFSDSYGWRMNK